MKIRMRENSLRLRVARSEMERLLKDGRIRETIRFAASPEASFTWALEAGTPENAATTVRCSDSDDTDTFANPNLAADCQVS